MHRAEKDNHVKIIVVAILGVLVAAGLTFLAVGHFSSNPSTPSDVTQTTISAAPVDATKPPTAAQVAAQLNCGRFHDDGPGASGIVKDSGICWINGVKYGVDTFANSVGRDMWVKLSEGFGGNAPLKESDVMVFYKASDQGNNVN